MGDTDTVQAGMVAAAVIKFVVYLLTLCTLYNTCIEHLTTILFVLFVDVGLKCGGLFRLSAGNPKLVERLRVSFDRTGDADLEGAGDVATVASLLKLWLRELPEPVIASPVAAELLDVHESKCPIELPVYWLQNPAAVPVYPMSRALQQLLCVTVVRQSKDRWRLLDRNGKLCLTWY